ncbi:MAG: transporter substrate-binding domain-containing protein, partial [Anaerolineae bacterium]
MRLRQPPSHAATRWLLRALVVVIMTILAFAVVVSHPHPLSAQTEPPRLRVVIKPLVPFVIADGDSYRGFSIDLWQEIANRMGRNYDYQFVETVKEQLDTVEQDRADIAITGISITRAREEAVDFSLPYFQAGL